MQLVIVWSKSFVDISELDYPPMIYRNIDSHKSCIHPISVDIVDSNLVDFELEVVVATLVCLTGVLCVVDIRQ